MLKNEVAVTRDTVLDAVSAKIPQGFRFVTMTCVDCGDAFDIIYHFDKDYVLHNIRLKLAKGETLRSISGVCFAAAIVENEIKDLFGINVDGLVLDYEGRFMLAQDAPHAPQVRTIGVATPSSI